MGKYIRKAKTTGELAVMEVSQSSLGVRTRARTLALQKSPAPPSPAAAVRVLPAAPEPPAREAPGCSFEPGLRAQAPQAGVEEASFGENVLEFEGRERSTRESTPCSLIRDPDTIRTPGSTTRPTGSTETNRRMQNTTRRHIPTAHEMDEFFAAAEEEQQRQFIDKYNFDPVNDKPLPGRYEWEKLDP
ncbi:hypothetical protein SLA2020_284360 [Shorea laevis]